MKKFLMAGIVGLTISGVGVAMTDESGVNYGPYLGVTGGLAIPSGSSSEYLNVGPDVGGQLGYQAGNLRIEGAFNYLSNSFSLDDDVVLRMTTLMANAYYDFNFGSVFVPYVGAGLGWLHAWATSTYYTVLAPDNNEFAFQGMAGFRFRATNHVTLDIGYRLLGWSDNNGNENIIETGLSYTF